MRVGWLKRALHNLGEEAELIARDDPKAAAKVVLRIERVVELLAEHPEIGRPGRVSGTRELVVPGTPYLVPYRIKGDHVEILRVFHGRRRWP